MLTALLDKQEESRRREREEAEKIRKEEAERMRIREERLERERKEAVERLEKQRKEEVASQKKKDDELLELRREELEYVKKRDTEEAEKKLKREQVFDKRAGIDREETKGRTSVGYLSQGGVGRSARCGSRESVGHFSSILHIPGQVDASLETVLTGKHAELLNSLHLPPEITFKAAKKYF